jgi:hypothetical protein
VAKPMNREQLAAKYSDATWRSKFREILAVSLFLENSIIAATYKPSDALNDEIVPTAAGRQVAQDMITKLKSGPKEARLSCLLTTVYHDPLIDVEATNTDKLRKAVSEEVKAMNLRYPYIYGRVLYNQAAKLFATRRESLGTLDTVRLLEGTPQGVFQFDNLVSGPLGLLQSLGQRHIRPTQSIPLQHCADPSCHEVHRTRLTTDGAATINLDRPKLWQILEQKREDPWDWNGFIDLVYRDDRAKYDDSVHDGIAFLIGDALSVDEMRSLLIHLADHTSGIFRQHLEPLGFSGSSEAMFTSLTQETCMQLCLLADNAMLVKAVDDCIGAGIIKVSRENSRIPKVNGGWSFGHWGLRAEAGALGVRFEGDSSSLPILRLRRLISSLYDTSNLSDITSLEWQLRHIDGRTVQERLHEYVRSTEPSVVLETLGLSSRDKAEKIGSILGIVASSPFDDQGFVDRALWKLGFSEQRRGEPQQRFWTRHERISQLARAAAMSS